MRLMHKMLFFADIKVSNFKQNSSFDIWTAMILYHFEQMCIASWVIGSLSWSSFKSQVEIISSINDPNTVFYI